MAHARTVKYRVLKNSVVGRAAIDLKPFAETVSWRRAEWEEIRTVREVTYTEKDLYHCDRKYYYFFLPKCAHPYTILEVDADDIREIK